MDDNKKKDDNKKRALSSSEQSARFEYAKEQLSIKNETYKPKDKHHEFVLCFDCIQDGFPQENYKYGQVIHRRDRLNDHYKQHHPSNPPMEWPIADSAPKVKQAKLSFSKSKPQQSSTKSISEKDVNAIEIEDITQPPSSKSYAGDTDKINTVITTEEYCDKDSDAKEFDEGQKTEFLSVEIKKNPGFFDKIYSALVNIAGKVSEIYDIVKVIARKHRVAENPLTLEYGRFTTIENEKLLIDERGIKTAISTCTNIMQVFTYLPFLGLNETEDKVLCEFCPDAQLAYYENKGNSSQRFGNTKTIILKHVTSSKHKTNLETSYKQELSHKEMISKDQKAGLTVFKSVYGGLKMGFSFKEIIRELSVLHHNGVGVGNINHSKGTIAQIKETIGKTLRQNVRKKLSEKLPATTSLRPVSEMFDKMTHHNRTGQMQLVVAPLMNEHELLTPVYLDNYLIDPDSNKYSDMISMVRETGNSYYDISQVENASADGAYSKSSSTRQCYKESLNLKESEWVNLKWDYAHQIDRAENDAKQFVQEVNENLNLAQEVTKLFRYGKEYVRVFGQAKEVCISLKDDIIQEVSREDKEELFLNKVYQPVIMSNLKFAAYGCKFLYNYKNNVIKYIVRINEMQFDKEEDEDKVMKFRNYLSHLNLKHFTIIFGLYDIYKLISKCQHGVSQVNQLPWQYNEKLENLKKDLMEISLDSYCGELKDREGKLLEGLIEDEKQENFPVMTEMSRTTKSTCTKKIKP